MTRIIIADDQALFREGLRTLLSTRPDMDVVGEAGDGDEAVALVEKLQPAVVLMDLRMPNADGIQATARIRARWPEIPVLVLTTFDDDANLFGALRAGAAGYLLKDVSSETLVSAIQAATRGESFLQSTVTGRVVAAFARLLESGGPKAEALVLPLSPREREILVLLGNASNKEIADRLNLAEGTVKNHVTNILTKLDVRDRTQAAIRARQLGIRVARSVYLCQETHQAFKAPLFVTLIRSSSPAHPPRRFLRVVSKMSDDFGGIRRPRYVWRARLDSNRLPPT